MVGYYFCLHVYSNVISSRFIVCLEVPQKYILTRSVKFIDILDKGGGGEVQVAIYYND